MEFNVELDKAIQNAFVEGAVVKFDQDLSLLESKDKQKQVVVEKKIDKSSEVVVEPQVKIEEFEFLKNEINLIKQQINDLVARSQNIETKCSEENISDIVLNVVDQNFKPIVESFNSVVNGFNDLRQDIFNSSEKQIIELVFSILKKITFGNINDETSIITLIEKAIDYCSSKGQINIHLSPKHAEIINYKKSSMEIFKGRQEIINIVADSKIIEGGCLIETSMGMIDAKLENQLAEIEKQFKEGVMDEEGKTKDERPKTEGQREETEDEEGKTKDERLKTEGQREETKDQREETKDERQDIEDKIREEEIPPDKGDGQGPGG